MDWAGTVELAKGKNIFSRKALFLVFTLPTTGQ
jgi:hypothetical protein